MHGGATPRGTASPNTRHGRYSRSMPRRLDARYEVARADPELLSVRDDEALIQAEIERRLEALRDAEPAVSMLDLQRRIERMLAEGRSWDAATTERQVREIAAVIEAAHEQETVLEGVFELLGRKARLARQEHRRLVDLEQLLTSEEALLVAAALTEAVRRVVGDKDVLEVLEVEFREILSLPEPGS